MSKTTIALLLFLFLALGGFFYVLYDVPESPLMKSLTPQAKTQTSVAKTTLSLVSNFASVQRGQTITVAVTIANQGLQPALAQLEIAYDPTVLTVMSVLPGTYFTKPTIALENISADVGRISYALKCPQNNCANAGSTNVAAITFLVNPAAAKPSTIVTFLPKTLVRDKNGTNILDTINNLTIGIAGAQLPIASPAAQLGTPSAH